VLSEIIIWKPFAVAMDWVFTIFTGMQDNVWGATDGKKPHPDALAKLDDVNIKIKNKILLFCLQCMRLPVQNQVQIFNY
jgi:hypothetical protein